MYAQGCKDGWFPKFFAQLNSKGEPWVLYIIGGIIGVYPILSGFSVAKITNNAMLLMNAANLLPIIAILYIPKKYPEAWKEANIMPRGMFYFVITFCFIVKVILTALAGMELTPTAVTVSLGSIVAALLYAYLRVKGGYVDVEEKRLEW
jgi:APA family basic amino acid/polyamine antiporter